MDGYSTEPLDVFVIAYVENAELAARVAAALRVRFRHYAVVRTQQHARRLLTHGPVPGAIVADRYEANLVALAPALPWVWLAHPRTRVDRGVVLAPEHVDELHCAIQAAANLARCEVALRLFRHRPAADIAGEPTAPRPPGSFDVSFQPRWSMDATRLVGAEALLRSPDPGRSAGALLECTFDHLATWRALWPDDAAMSLDVTTGQLADPGFAALIGERLRASAIPPDWLELHLDVGSLHNLAPQHVANLRAVRGTGTALVADRVGFRSFDPGKLAKLPFTALELDRLLVAGIPSRPHAVVLVTRLTELARRLSFTTFAVGVETNEQREFLRTVGCTAFQGFLLAEPMPHAEFEALLTAHREVHLHGTDRDERCA